MKGVPIMVDTFKDQSDEWWLEQLTPLYSFLGVQIDTQVVKAIRKAYESHTPGSPIFQTIADISQETGVPWYKFYIYFAFAFGRLGSMLDPYIKPQSPEQGPPS